MKKRTTYEDKADIIDKELEKRRGKWFLNSLNWFDFEDVKQIIRAHIYNKWDQWDQSRSIEPWINRIISNQMKNILRNNYGNFCRPCLSCPFGSTEPSSDGIKNTFDNLCSFTPSGLQCNECPLYKKWEKTKKEAYNIKMPLEMEYHQNEVSSISNNNIFNIDSSIENINKELKKVLTSKQYEIYEMLYIKDISEDEVAKKLGYKTTEKGRRAGYKQIKNFKKMFKDKVVKIIQKKDVFYDE